MATDELSKVTTLAALQAYAQGKGLDLNQAPKVEDDETGRRVMRRWIRDMENSKSAVAPVPTNPEPKPAGQTTVTETKVTETKVAEPKKPVKPIKVEPKPAGQTTVTETKVTEKVVEPKPVSETVVVEQQRQSWVWPIVVVVVIALLIIGCLVFSGQGWNTLRPAQVAVAVATNVSAAAQPTEAPAAVVPTEAPAAVVPTEAPAQPTATNQPQPTSTAGTTDSLAKLGNTMMAFPEVKNSMNAGDGVMNTLAYFEDAFGSKFVAAIEAGNDLNVESVQIAGKFIMTKSAIGDVVSAGEELCKKTGCTTKMYVGDASTPSGWTKDCPSGFACKTTKPFLAHTDQAKWDNPIMFQNTETHAIGDPEKWEYGQLTIDGTTRYIVHYIIEPGMSATTAKLQGTNWKVLSDQPDVIATFLNMTEEVKIRDVDPKTKLPPKIIMIYIGTKYAAPDGWSTNLPDGWSVN